MIQRGKQDDLGRLVGGLSLYIESDLSLYANNHWLWKGNGNPLQYSCLENPMDRGDRQATVHRVANSQT